MDGLKYCHDSGICHRDLKPENLLLDKDFNLKIADFGFARLIEDKDEDGKLFTCLGTAGYMAPEQHQKKPYEGEKIDIFAAGVILFVMVAAHPPFDKAIPRNSTYKFIGGGRNDLFWKAMSKNKE